MIFILARSSIDSPSRKILSPAPVSIRRPETPLCVAFDAAVSTLIFSCPILENLILGAKNQASGHDNLIFLHLCASFVFVGIIIRRLLRGSETLIIDSDSLEYIGWLKKCKSHGQR
jgi:hypothetical protein